MDAAGAQGSNRSSLRMVFPCQGARSGHQRSDSDTIAVSMSSVSSPPSSAASLNHVKFASKAILLWNLIHHMILNYQNNYPN